MFIFELKCVNRKNDAAPLQIDEFHFALLLRVLRTRNRDLYNRFNAYYDKLSEGQR